jgi:predicted nucleotidyltransferase
VDDRTLADLLDACPDVSLAYLFGSVARGEARRDSDLDLAVRFSGTPTPARVTEIAAAAERVTGRPEDLVVLNSAPPLLVHEVVATGRLVVCRDDDDRAAFEALATIRYLDTGHLRRIQHRYLRERADARRAAAR